MSKILYTCIATLLWAIPVLAQKPSLPGARSAVGGLLGYVPDECIVVLREGVSVQAGRSRNGFAATGQQSLDGIADRHRVRRFVRQFPGERLSRAKAGSLPGRLACHYKARFPVGMLDDVFAAYEADPLVDHVERIGIHLLHAVPADVFEKYQWHWDQGDDHDVDGYEAWGVETGNQKVIVAILDSGVRYYHRDIGGRDVSLARPDAADGNMWINWQEKHGTAGVDDDGNGYVDDWIGWDFVDVGDELVASGEDGREADNDPVDFNAHGTHCAGSVGALTNNGYGVGGAAGGWGNGSLDRYGNGVKVMACRIGYTLPGDDGVVRMDFAAEALYYAADNGARIASCSWGSSNTGGISAAADYFVANGGLIFKSAGNDGINSADYLCSRSDIISVAATDSGDCRADFSNYGTWVDISAPGVDIWSLFHNPAEPNLDYVSRMSGTSMAAPLAAGIAALVWSQDPSASAAAVVSALYAAADDIYGLSCNSDRSGMLGAGRINAYAALNTSAVRPRADFTADSRSGCSSLDVQFTDRSTGTVTGRLWDFGDGQFSTGVDPLHSYTTEGLYPVALRVTGPDGIDSITRHEYIAVCGTPAADFTTDIAAGPAPLTVAFTDISSGHGLSWEWDFGDGGGTSVLPDPTRTFVTPGTYTVALTVTNACGSDTETKVSHVTVAGEAPDSAVAQSEVHTLGIEYSNDYTATHVSDDTRQVLVEQTYTFPPTYTWLEHFWTFDVPPGSGKALVVEARRNDNTDDDDFEFAIALDGGLTFVNLDTVNSATEAVYVMAIPDTIEGPTTFRVWDTEDESAGETRRDTLQVDFMAVVVSNPSVPAPIADYTADITYGARPFTTQFTDLSIGHVTDWVWSFGDDDTAYTQHPAHTYTDTGLFRVELTVTGDGGSNTKGITGFVHLENAGPTADAGPDRSVDENTAVTLDGSGTLDPDGDDLSYHWTQLSGHAADNDDTLDAQSDFTTPYVPGPCDLVYQLAVTDGMFSDTDTVVVHIVNATTTADDFVADTISVSGLGDLHYRYYVPPSYDGVTPIALVVHLHGAGGRRNPGEGGYNEAPIEGIYYGARIWAHPDSQANYPCIVVNPQCPRTTRWSNMCYSGADSDCWGDVFYSQDQHTPANDVLELVRQMIVDTLLTQFSIDPRRVYVTGQSMGAFGAWDIATRWPRVFAATLPVSGGVDTAKVDSLLYMGVRPGHGSADGLVPPGACDSLMYKLVATQSALGLEQAVYEHYTDVPNDHNIWERYYTRTDNLIGWTFTQVRNYPPTVVADTVSVPEDSSLDIVVLTNDSDYDGDGFSVRDFSAAEWGDVVLHPDGSFTYTPSPDFAGVDSFQYVVTDTLLYTDPLLADDTLSDSGWVHVTVEPVNDAPDFLIGPDIAVAEDCGPQVFAGWLGGVAAGPADESSQALGFRVSVPNPGMFATLPVVDAGTGELSFTPADDSNGVVTVSVRLGDDGGTVHGGVDSSDVKTFTITVNAVDDPPIVWLNAADTVRTTPGADIEAVVSDIDGGPAVTLVGFFSGTALLAVDANEPWELPWDVPPLGTHALWAAAVDADGDTAFSDTITLIRPWRIMPLGNSITESRAYTDGDASYRCFLWNMAVTDGYDIDFVGSRTGVWSGGPLSEQAAANCPYAGFDEDHEGHWGWRTDEVLHYPKYGGETISDWMDSYSPDVVLVHLGTNDMFQRNDVVQSLTELDDLIDTLRAHNPDVTILLARLIGTTRVGGDLVADSVYVNSLNALIPGLAQSKSTSQSPVILTDQHTNMDPAAQLYDGTHPDESGEITMAYGWYKPLAPVLDDMPLPAAVCWDDRTVDEGDAVTVDGSDSYDPLTETESFAWTIIDGLTPVLNGASTSTLSFTAPATLVPDSVVLELVVAAGGRTGRDTITVCVNPVNDPPDITTTAPTTATEDAEYTYAPSATDVENDNLTWSLSNEPAGMTVDPATGAIAWTPTEGVLSSGTVTLTVTDDGSPSESDNETIIITVTPVNDPPQISWTPVTAAAEQTLYAHTVTATDPDAGDDLTFSLTAAPPAMTIDAVTGALLWQPSPMDIGEHPVSVRVDDLAGAYDQLPFTLTVSVLTSGVTITGAHADTRIYAHATSGWHGAHRLTGNGSITLPHGVHTLAAVEPGMRIEHYPVTITPGAFTPLTVDMRPTVPVTFGTLEAVVDNTATPINTGGWCAAVMQDLDGDGDIDLAAGLLDGAVREYINDGGLALDGSVSLGLQPGEDLSGLRVVDLDGDGRLEYLVGLSTGAVVAYDIATLDSSLVYTAEPGLSGIDLTDLNGDHLPDLVLGYEDGSLSLAVSNGENTWQPPSALQDESAAPLDAVGWASPLCIHMTADTLLDLVVGDLFGTTPWFQRRDPGDYRTMGNAAARGEELHVFADAALSLRRSAPGQLPTMVVSDGAGAVYTSRAGITGDTDNSGLVDFADLLAFIDAWNTQEGDTAYNRAANLVLSPTGPQKIEFVDLLTFVDVWNVGL